MLHEETQGPTESTVVSSPLAAIEITANKKGVCRIHFCGKKSRKNLTLPDIQNPHLRQAARELDEYFLGKRTQFTFPVTFSGTPFQKRVWKNMLRIPFGKTVSYGDLARQVGSPRAARAVGMANNRNPIAIAVPCHRVIGANGNLTGYAGGLHLKEWLLSHERKFH